MKRTPLTAQRLREVLHYSPSTGRFKWKMTRGRQAAGAEAGSYVNGYVRIWVDSRPYLAQRLAWLYMKGGDDDTLAIAPPQVDHRDTDGENNRWRNLRAATQTLNQRNTGARARNLCGFKWVRTRKYPSGNIAYQAVVGQFSIGCFATPERAHRAAALRAKKLHGAFFNAGTRNDRRHAI